MLRIKSVRHYYAAYFYMFTTSFILISGCGILEEKPSITVSKVENSSFTIYTSPSLSLREQLLRRKENRRRISFLVTDSKGNPLPSKRVDFEIIEGTGKVSRNSGITNTSGNIYTDVATPETATVKATVYGYDSSVTYRLEGGK